MKFSVHAEAHVQSLKLNDCRATDSQTTSSFGPLFGPWLERNNWGDLKFIELLSSRILKSFHYLSLPKSWAREQLEQNWRAEAEALQWRRNVMEYVTFEHDVTRPSFESWWVLTPPARRPLS